MMALMSLSSTVAGARVSRLGKAHFRARSSQRITARSTYAQRCNAPFFASIVAQRFTAGEMEFQANESRQGRKSASIVPVGTFCRSQYWNPNKSSGALLYFLRRSTPGHYHFKSDGFAQDIT
jgi:hypothetical protein